jgi:tripartite-type tricarboxylate transporter receptor subunit TctC
MLKPASIILACALAALQATAIQAQTAYPARDITFIVPWNAGGSNDVAARALDPILREHGIKIVIENVVGATGTIGMRRVASAAPDGYTIGMGTSSTLALIAQGKTPLTNAQFTHIARVSTDPLMLLVSADCARFFPCKPFAMGRCCLLFNGMRSAPRN